MKKNLLSLLFVLPIVCFISCGNGDDDTEIKDTQSVTINDDGTTSDGSRFTGINENSFYLDYINYSLEEGHLTVAGYDKVGFNGIVKIYPSITYKGKKYEVLTISKQAFQGCSKLTQLTIPNTITTIGKEAFSGCLKMESVEIGNSVKTINDEAFWGCSSLKTITIPQSVNIIGNDAFGYCFGLTSLTIPKSVMTIRDGAFANCVNLASITVENGNSYFDSRDDCNAIIKTTSNELIAGCKNTVVPSSVKSFANSAFNGCKDLKNITIPDGATKIGDEAFKGCSNLTSITIPSSVTSIGENAFKSCI